MFVCMAGGGWKCTRGNRFLLNVVITLEIAQCDKQEADISFSWPWIPEFWSE